MNKQDEGFARNLRLFGPWELYEGMDGRPLYKVELSDDKSEVSFTFQDGGRVSFGAKGDCCSQSWIEHLEAPDDVNGRTLVSVEDDRMETDEEPPVSTDECYYDDYLQVYQTIFRLDNGESIKLEYRNTSNGYYGGYLVRLGGA
jgi:hypothetical protein